MILMIFGIRTNSLFLLSKKLFHINNQLINGSNRVSFYFKASL